MTSLNAPEDITCTIELCEAVLSLRGHALGESLGRIARALLESPQGGYFQGDLPETSDLAEEIFHGSAFFGRYAVSGRIGGYDYIDRMRLAALARLTARLLQARADADRSARQFEKATEQLLLQTQILDQIHESVITMDLTGFITSWNKGAEKLFGYAATEIIGRNIIFLYENQEDEEDPSQDIFLQQGGREMEVRRRKKSGEIFWASLSLSSLRDNTGQPVGLIGYFMDITERKQAQEKIHHLAYYDALTGLPNRTLFMKLVDQSLVSASRNGSNGALLFIDLNRFKPINDTLGHGVGDQLLQQVAVRFKDALRDDDIMARLGSDEFVVGLFDLNQHYHAGFVAQKLLYAMEHPYLIEGHELRMGASIGISTYAQDGTDSETLLRLADIAMYRAKKCGENDHGSYAFYSQEMNRAALSRLHIETGLRRAIGSNELLLYYQPKINIEDGRIVGAEALVRWQHPERGLVFPSEFIPIAEESRLVVRLGEWVLEAACRQAAAWQRAGLAPMRVAINLSAGEFTVSLPGRVQAALRRHGIDADWLELEITESMLMIGTDDVIAIMEEIAGLGVTLSLDDFGTGYSSLSYLKRFPIHTLKIDRSFIMGIPKDQNDCAIAGAIIGIAKQLQHRVIAEGVENAEQLDFLRNQGCEEIQGYFFSRPVASLEMEKMLREDRRFGVERCPDSVDDLN
ncbi:bifunctional diguanylate cyclase/phosphodiesterase [Herminiimonas sp. CN]|uniref:putative bifunctional diguanylate cyclase/phosphodiesterase n=1 Tax=Herminiimonas sp. CN TaxID=1349818 RepID=UPI000473EDC0|nr:EAL domain-containing protein [Herminiimonas sp. CN]